MDRRSVPHFAVAENPELLLPLGFGILIISVPLIPHTGMFIATIAGAFRVWVRQSE